MELDIKDEEIDKNLKKETENPEITITKTMEQNINKQKGSLTTFFAFAVILVSIIAGFFAYQNQKLVKELREKTQPTQTPVIEITPTPDPTANWKVYTNSEIGFSIKYPQEWTLQKTTSQRIASFDTTSGTPGDFFIAFNKNIADLSKWLSSNQAGEIIDTISINKNQFTVIKGGALNISRDYAIKIGTNNYLRFVVEPFPNTLISDEIINQILSTFEFLDQSSPSPSPTSKAEGCIEKTTCTGTTPCMANPASVFCTCMGGKSAIKTLDDGSQSGICTINGKAQDEWTYYRSFLSTNKTIMPKQ